jgi:hypothetical protein
MRRRTGSGGIRALRTRILPNRKKNAALFQYSYSALETASWAIR